MPIDKNKIPIIKGKCLKCFKECKTCEYNSNIRPLFAGFDKGVGNALTDPYGQIQEDIKLKGYYLINQQPPPSSPPSSFSRPSSEYITNWIKTNNIKYSLFKDGWHANFADNAIPENRWNLRAQQSCTDCAPEYPALAEKYKIML